MLQLYTSETGDGFPLIILHGLLGMGDNWAMIAKKLSGSFRVIVPDMRNHGRSPHTSDHSYELMAEDILNLCKIKGFNKVHLLGHSMGGKVAMTIACLEPSIVDRLIIADIGPGTYTDAGHHTYLLHAMMGIHPEDFATRSEVDDALSMKISDQRIRMFLLKNLTRNKNNLLSWKANLPVLLSQSQKVLEGISPDGLFTGKTLFLKGALSDYISEEQCEMIYKQFPSASIVTIDNAGHWIHADATDVFTRYVIDFLTS